MLGANPDARELVGAVPIGPAVPVQILANADRTRLQGMAGSEPTRQQPQRELQVRDRWTPHRTDRGGNVLGGEKWPEEPEQCAFGGDAFCASPKPLRPCDQRVQSAGEIMLCAQASSAKKHPRRLPCVHVTPETMLTAAETVERLVRQPLKKRWRRQCQLPWVEDGPMRHSLGLATRSPLPSFPPCPSAAATMRENRRVVQQSNHPNLASMAP